MLAEALSDRLIEDGVVGGIYEAEDGIAGISKGNPVGSMVHAGSLAGFITLTSQGLIGLQPGRGPHIKFTPKFPRIWGNYTLIVKYAGGSFSIERISETTWRVGQKGIEPAFSIELDFTREFDRTAKISLRLMPNESAVVTLNRTEGVWKARVKIND